MLASSSFQQVLKSQKISIIDIHPVKQTDTTQRWKLKTQGPASHYPTPTKIEFSKRKIDNQIITNYHLYPILASHYDINSALSQKIEALVYRTQARDIFDIAHLLEKGAQLNPVSDAVRIHFETAMHHILEAVPK